MIVQPQSSLHRFRNSKNPQAVADWGCILAPRGLPGVAALKRCAGPSETPTWTRGICAEAWENALVVECQKCGTRFQLDAARIPDDGIRVRCSRCKNAFYLQHPSQSQADAVEAVVEEAVAHEQVAPPGTTQDLPISQQSDPQEMSAGSISEVEFADADDEDDWEFNEELPEYDDELEPAPDDFVASDFNNDSQEVGSIDLEHDRSLTSDPGLSQSDPAEVSAVVSDSGEMGAEDLLASSMSVEGMEATGQAPLADVVQPDSGMACVREDAFGSPDDFSNLIGEETPAPVATPVASQDEVSEDPEDWDFFGDSDSERPAAAAAAQGAQGPMTDLVATTAAAQDQAPSAEAQVPGGWKGLEGDRPVSGLAGVASALAWVACLGLLTAGVYLGVVGSIDRSVSAPAFVGVGEMRAANIRGQFLETERAGILYVVTGDLVNPGNAARAVDYTLLVTLLGRDGRELDSPPAFAGREVEFDSLREMSIAELQESRLSASRSLAIMEIGPGESAGFVAAFVAMPEAASHFKIRAVTAGPPALAGEATRSGDPQ